MSYVYQNALKLFLDYVDSYNQEYKSYIGTNKVKADRYRDNITYINNELMRMYMNILSMDFQSAVESSHNIMDKIGVSVSDDARNVDSYDLGQLRYRTSDIPSASEIGAMVKSINGGIYSGNTVSVDHYVKVINQTTPLAETIYYLMETYDPDVFYYGNLFVRFFATSGVSPRLEVSNYDVSMQKIFSTETATTTELYDFVNIFTANAYVYKSASAPYPFTSQFVGYKITIS